ncbi:MAG: hypothetical protein ACLGG0_06505 [Bacteriovoracia bacterium]
MSEKKAVGQDAALADSLKNMGFGDDAALAKYLANPQHQKIQSKFDQVFSRQAEATRTIVGLAAAGSSGADDKSMEIDLDFTIGSEQDGEVAMVDKDLELDDVGELSLSEDAPQTISTDDDLDLSLDADESVEAPSASEDFDLSLDESSAEETVTELRLGDAGGLEEDVLAKLAEIEEIMVADATQTMMRPAPGELKEVTNPALAMDDLDLSAEGGEEISLSDDGADALSLGAEALLDDGAGDELSLSGDVDALDLGEGSLNELSDPGMIEVANFEADPEESLFTRSGISLGAELKTLAKKQLPSAPTLEQDDESGDEELSFAVEERVEQSISKATSPSIKISSPSVGEATKPSFVLPQEVPQSKSSSSVSTKEERSNYQSAVGNYNAELERLQATLNHLRGDRGELLKKIEQLEEDKLSQQRLGLNMRAELDEKKIEIQLMKKRMTEESQDLKYQFELEQERRKLAEERAREYQGEIQALQQKVKLEVKKVSSRERELEQKLELLKSDAETQIRHRDMKILELKRRIDAMEFEMDTLNSLEQKSMGDKTELEGKLDKAIKTLRTAIGILEVDDPKLATLEKLKKNLDV